LPAIAFGSSRKSRIMLVLSRKVDESIVLTSPHLSGEIVIKYLRNNYQGIDREDPIKSITIGITAPSDVLVLRSELTSGNTDHKPDDTHGGGRP
jgi:sRNA-binding carbon storage regulator CsrA